MKRFQSTADYLTHIYFVRLRLQLAKARYRAEQQKHAQLKDRVAKRRQFARMMRAWINYYALHEYLKDLLRGTLN